MTRPGPSAPNGGYTLIELVVSMVAANALLFGLGSALFIASQGVRDVGSAAAYQANAAVTQLVLDGQFALALPERTTYAITFAVPDRDDDASLETVRYAWSGVEGGPLIRQINGGPEEELVAEVHDFWLLVEQQDTRAVAVTLYLQPTPDPSTAFRTTFALLNQP